MSLSSASLIAFSNCSSKKESLSKTTQTLPKGTVAFFLRLIHWLTRDSVLEPVPLIFIKLLKSSILIIFTNSLFSFLNFSSIGFANPLK